MLLLVLLSTELRLLNRNYVYNCSCIKSQCGKKYFWKNHSLPKIKIDSRVFISGRYGGVCFEIAIIIMEKIHSGESKKLLR